jgi:propanol-preferring alcohol dehydrogenase
VQQENLCDHLVFTGYIRDGSFATAIVAVARFAFPHCEVGSDVSLAPLLRAGLIGRRSLTTAGDSKTLGLYDFGAAASIIAQAAKWQGRSVYNFTRPGDIASQAFARTLGATWAGGSDETPPEKLDAASIFATVGELVPRALKAAHKGVRVVCGGIHMSDIPSFPYAQLWEERQVLSVTTLTREDGIDFPRQAPEMTSSRIRRPTRSGTQTRPWPISVPAASTAPPFSTLEGSSRSDHLTCRPLRMRRLPLTRYRPNR